jgi:hypothetical protein
VYSVLAVLYTYPLVLHLSDRVIGPARGDNLEYLWKIWWVAHALFDLHTSPMFIPSINVPNGYPLAYGDLTSIHTFFAAPFTYVFGEVIVYNLAILLSFILTGTFTFIYVKELVGHRGAAFFAGFLFAFCNFRMARVGTHLPLMDTQWIVLFMLFLERFIRKFSLKDALLAGLFFSLAGLSTIYYPAMLILLAPFYAAIRLWKLHGKDTLLKNGLSILIGGIVFCAVCLALLLPAVVPYMQIQKNGAAVVPMEDVVFWSADISNYLIPNPYQFLWSGWEEAHIPMTLAREGVANEYVIGLGFVGVLFALYGYVKSSKRERAGWGWWFWAAFLLSLGPAAKIFNRLIVIDTPMRVGQVYHSIIGWLSQHSLVADPVALGSPDQLFLPLPGLFVRWFLPGFSSVRSWGRFSLFVMLAVAVWAAIGLKKFLEEETGGFSRLLLLKSRIFLIVLILFSGFEAYNGPQVLVDPAPRAVDAWLAQHDPQAPIIQMPILSALSGPQMFYTRYHHHPIVGGYGTYLPLLFTRQYPELQQFPSDPSLDVLQHWGCEMNRTTCGVKFILVDEADITGDDPLWQEIQNQHRLVETIVLEGVHVFTITDY